MAERRGFITIQYQPFKAPNEWTKEERQLLMRINHTFEDLYTRIGQKKAPTTFYNLPLIQAAANIHVDPDTGKLYRSVGVSEMVIAVTTDTNSMVAGQAIAVTGAVAGGTPPYTYKMFAIADRTEVTPLIGDGPVYTYIPTKVGSLVFQFTATDREGNSQTAESSAYTVMPARNIVVQAVASNYFTGAWRQVVCTANISGGIPPYSVTFNMMEYWYGDSSTLYATKQYNDVMASVVADIGIGERYYGTFWFQVIVRDSTGSSAQTNSNKTTI